MTAVNRASSNLHRERIAERRNNRGICTGCDPRSEHDQTDIGCKTVGSAYVGSNPTPATEFCVGSAPSGSLEVATLEGNPGNISACGGKREGQHDLPSEPVDEHRARDVPAPRRQPGQERENAGEVRERGSKNGALASRASPEKAATPKRIVNTPAKRVIKI